MSHGIACFLLLILLTGCSQEVPFATPAPGPAPAAAAAAAGPANCSSPAAAASSTQVAENTIFAVTLIDHPKCSENVAATAVAKWNVSSLHATSVSIFVISPANGKKLWLEGGASGEATTGQWVFKDTCFALENKDTGGVLASRRIESIPCTP